MASKLQSMSRLFAEFSSSPALAPVAASALSASASAAAPFAASSSSSYAGDGEEEDPLAASAPSAFGASYTSRLAAAASSSMRGRRPPQPQEEGAGRQLRSLSSFLRERGEGEEDGAGPLAASFPPITYSSSLVGGGGRLEGGSSRTSSWRNSNSREGCFLTLDEQPNESKI